MLEVLAAFAKNGYCWCNVSMEKFDLLPPSYSILRLRVKGNRLSIAEVMISMLIFSPATLFANLTAHFITVKRSFAQKKTTK